MHFGEGPIWILSGQLQVGVRLAQKVLLVKSHPIPSQLQCLFAVSDLFSSDLCTIASNVQQALPISTISEVLYMVGL